MKRSLKQCFILFYNFFIIGLFTFGGGLAMIPLISKIVINKYQWMTEDDMVDMIAIAESTPGVIAVNSATYVGYKLNKFWGAFFATLGVIMPSFVIICILSIFYETFMDIEIVSWAFMGIRACVAVLILNAGIKLLKNIKKNIYSVLILLASFLVSLFTKIVSTVYIIIIGLILGVIVYSIYERIHSKRYVK